MRIAPFAWPVIILVLLAPAARGEPAPARTSPFDAVYIDDDGTMTVTVGDVKGKLVSIDGLDAGRLALATMIGEGDRWKKRLAEDLGDAVEAARGTRPPEVVDLVVESEDGTRHEITARFDEEKRAAIYQSDYGAGRDFDQWEIPYDPAAAERALGRAAGVMNAYWSYRGIEPGVDVEAELMKLVPDETVPLMVLAEGTQKVLAMFPDGHAGVANLWNRQSRKYLPGMAVLMGGGRVALMEEGENGAGVPIDPERPYLLAIDGWPVAEWIAAARLFEPTAHSGSDWHVVERLRLLPMLRRELDAPQSDVVRLTLGDENGGNKTEIERPIGDDYPPGRPRPWHESPDVKPFDVRQPDLSHYPPAMAEMLRREGPRPSEGGSRVLDGGVGYLQLKNMDDEPEFLRSLAEAMQSFRDAPGLVIDVRGNGGGSRMPLLVLWSYLADPDAQPVVANLAKPILYQGEPLAPLDARFMYPADWPMWTADERAAIESIAADFEPAWQPDDQFGTWHHLVLGGRFTDVAARLHGLPEPYHFDRPVVVLMDGDCFSATSIFLAAVDLLDNVTFVGIAAPAGSGRTMEHRVGTDFELYLSTMASFLPDGRLFDGNVIEPDVEAWPTLSDLAGETDTQLDAAVAALE